LGGPSQSLKNYRKDWDDERGVWKVKSIWAQCPNSRFVLLAL